MAQAQFNEVLNFALCSRADVTTNIFNPDESKLITISKGETTMDTDQFNYAIKMEEERIKRVNEIKAKHIKAHAAAKEQ